MNKEEGKDWCSPFIPHILTQLKNYFLTLVCVNNINKTCSKEKRGAKENELMRVPWFLNKPSEAHPPQPEASVK